MPKTKITRQDITKLEPCWPGYRRLDQYLKYYDTDHIPNTVEGIIHYVRYHHQPDDVIWAAFMLLDRPICEKIYREMLAYLLPSKVDDESATIVRRTGHMLAILADEAMFPLRDRKIVTAYIVDHFLSYMSFRYHDYMVRVCAEHIVQHEWPQEK